MINRTKVKESTQIKPGDNGDVLVMKDNAPEWSTPSDAGLAEQASVDSELSKKQDKLVAGDNIYIDGNTISAASEPTPISIGTVTEGDTAMVSNSGTDTNVVLNFVMPKGVKGDQGPQGNPGTAATVTVGTTTTGEAGTEASVTNSGTTSAAVLNFVIPKGNKGDKGEKGDPGQAGTEVNNLAPLVVRTAPVAGDEDSIAIGAQANASAGGYIAIGDHSEASGSTSGNYGSVSVGYGARSKSRGVAVGNQASSDAFAVAIGYRADTGGNTQSVVIGHQSTAAASCYHPVAVGADIEVNDSNATALGHVASIGTGGENSVSLGSYSSTAEPNVVSVGSGDATMSLSDDMDEETKARIQARAAAATRRIVNVTDPTNAQDAATKNYVDTQLEPINAKLQYVPENTNQILSQIQTNVEKAQSAADAKVASITAGTGISVDDSNPTAPVVSTTGLATQASVDALTNTVNSKANQTDLEALQTTVAGKADTSALANYATKTELSAKADQSAVDAKVSSVTAGTGISITGSATNPVINATGGDSYITKSSSLEEAYAIGDDAVNHRANEVTVGSVEPSGGFLQPGEFTRLIAGVSTPTNRYDAANKLYVDTQLDPINTKLQHFPETFTDTGWMEITGSSGSGLKYLTGPWTIPTGAKVKIRKFGKRVTVVGIVQATEDISSGASTPLLSIPESDTYFDAFNLPQVSQYDIAHDQQKSAATSVLLIRGMLTSFNVEQNLDAPKINVTLVPVVGVAGQTAQIGNGDTVNFQISWDTED